MALIIQGILIGFAIAAPVGPIGVLCINRTLKSGLTAGFMTGLGAATADACYGCIAGFGLVAIADFLLLQSQIIRLIGGLFLIYLGIKSFLPHQRNELNDSARTLWQDFVSTFFLTLTNPATILSFIAIYASFGMVDREAHYFQALFLVLGVFIGSLLWWLILSTMIHSIRHKLNIAFIRWLDIFSGIVLLAFGLFAIATFFK